jgi:uncharacterized protein
VTSLVLAALLALAQGLAAVPPLTGPVVDQAGLLSRAEARRLEQLSRAAREGGGGQAVQLQFLLVPSLEGDAIEEFSIRVAEAWRLGTKGRDEGVLVVVARDDRKVRIEVGGGLEGQLTDAQSSRIIRGVLTPAFRAGRYGDGLYDAGLQILAATGALPPEAARRQAARPSHGARFGGLGFLALFVGFIVLRALFFGFSSRRRRGFWGGGGPFIGGGGLGGGWGRGGGGGGGWSGGGGGFSGGGSSGSW